jgi:hypothetical protein
MQPSTVNPAFARQFGHRLAPLAGFEHAGCQEVDQRTNAKGIHAQTMDRRELIRPAAFFAGQGLGHQQKRFPAPRPQPEIVILAAGQCSSNRP